MFSNGEDIFAIYSFFVLYKSVPRIYIVYLYHVLISDDYL